MVEGATGICKPWRTPKGKSTFEGFYWAFQKILRLSQTIFLSKNYNPCFYKKVNVSRDFWRYDGFYLILIVRKSRYPDITIGFIKKIWFTSHNRCSPISCQTVCFLLNIDDKQEKRGCYHKVYKEFSNRGPGHLGNPEMFYFHLEFLSGNIFCSSQKVEGSTISKDSSLLELNTFHCWLILLIAYGSTFDSFLIR